MLKTISFQIHACIKGYHAYKITPEVGEELTVSPKKTNTFGTCAMGVWQGTQLVGHVPAIPVSLNRALHEISSALPAAFGIKW